MAINFINLVERNFNILAPILRKLFYFKFHQILWETCEKLFQEKRHSRDGIGNPPNLQLKDIKNLKAARKNLTHSRPHRSHRSHFALYYPTPLEIKFLLAQTNQIASHWSHAINAPPMLPKLQLFRLKSYIALATKQLPKIFPLNFDFSLLPSLFFQPSNYFSVTSSTLTGDFRY